MAIRRIERTIRACDRDVVQFSMDGGRSWHMSHGTPAAPIANVKTDMPFVVPKPPAQGFARNPLKLIRRRGRRVFVRPGIGASLYKMYKNADSARRRRDASIPEPELSYLGIDYHRQHRAKPGDNLKNPARVNLFPIYCAYPEMRDHCSHSPIPYTQHNPRV